MRTGVILTVGILLVCLVAWLSSRQPQPVTPVSAPVPASAALSQDSPPAPAAPAEAPADDAEEPPPGPVSGVALDEEALWVGHGSASGWQLLDLLRSGECVVLGQEGDSRSVRRGQLAADLVDRVFAVTAEHVSTEVTRDYEAHAVEFPADVTWAGVSRWDGRLWRLPRAPWDELAEPLRAVLGELLAAAADLELARDREAILFAIEVPADALSNLPPDLSPPASLSTEDWDALPALRAAIRCLERQVCLGASAELDRLRELVNKEFQSDGEAWWGRIVEHDGRAYFLNLDPWPAGN